MDTLYSLTLLAALAAGVVSVVAAALALRWHSPRFRPVARWGGALALCSGAVSFAIHLVFGHGPAAPEPMDVGLFLHIHPAYWFVMVLVLVTFALLPWPRWRG